LTTGGMIKNAILLKIMLIFLTFTVFSFGKMTLFIILGLAILAGGCFLAFRQGAAMGHEACSISYSLKNIAERGDKDADPRMARQAYNMSGAVKAAFAGALPDYLINVAYIVFMLLSVEETALLIGRLASFIVVMPYWPIVAHWHEVYNVLTWDIVAVLMISPFLLPFCQLMGYRQGPAMWAKTEKAMADGKRRAKARSRIANRKKRASKGQRPEI